MPKWTPSSTRRMPLCWAGVAWMVPFTGPAATPFWKRALLPCNMIGIYGAGMSYPGPPVFRKCADCSQIIVQPIMWSYSLRSGSFWTDLKRDIPLIGMPLKLVICPHCHTLQWINELEKLGQAGDAAWEAGQFEHAKRQMDPSFDDYLNLAESGVENCEKERELRMYAWWVGNEVRRNNKDPKPLSDRESVNLSILAKMFNKDNDVELLMKTEAMRELGRFDEAKVILSRDILKDHLASKAMMGLVEAEDPYVKWIDLFPIKDTLYKRKRSPGG